MEAIAAIITSGVLESLIGLPEDQQLEAKRQEYDLTRAAGQYELAKDVSAFANSEGGYIIVGAGTTRSAGRDLDLISELVPLEADRFNTAQYRGVISEYVYPSVAGLTVDFALVGGGPNGVGVIMVPKQHPDAGPFLITKVVEDGERLKQIVAGFAIRQGARAAPLDPKAFQQRLQKGSDTTAQRLCRIEEKLDLLLELGHAETIEAGPELLKARVDKAFEEVE